MSYTKRVTRDALVVSRVRRQSGRSWRHSLNLTDAPVPWSKLAHPRPRGVWRHQAVLLLARTSPHLEPGGPSTHDCSHRLWLATLGVRDPSETVVEGSEARSGARQLGAGDGRKGGETKVVSCAESSKVDRNEMHVGRYLGSTTVPLTKDVTRCCGVSRGLWGEGCKGHGRELSRIGDEPTKESSPRKLISQPLSCVFFTSHLTHHKTNDRPRPSLIARDSTCQWLANAYPTPTHQPVWSEP